MNLWVICSQVLYIYSMTRKEQKALKLQKEKLFIESLKSRYISGKEKDKFRTTDYWKEFRKRFANLIDPITLRKLPKRFQLHHCDLNPEHYTDLKFDNFVPLTGKTHDIVHYLYGYYRKDKDVLKRLKRILDKMVELNDGKDVKDYKKPVDQSENS